MGGDHWHPRVAVRHAVIDSTMYATAPTPQQVPRLKNSSTLCVLKSKNFSVYLLPGIIKTWIYREGPHTAPARQQLTV